MKFAIVLPGKSIPPHIVDCLKEQPARSGFYNWLFAFKGEIKTWETIKDNLEEYDVLQVNMSPVDMMLVPEIRRKLGRSSSTKLVLNNDYVCEYWDNWRIDPFRYEQIQREGDMVFGTEKHQVSQMIKGSFCMPHPSNTKILKRFGVDPLSKKNSIGVICHWWAQSNLHAYNTARWVKEEYGLDEINAYGYSKKEPMERYSGVMYNNIYDLMDFPSFLTMIQQEKILYDPNPFHTYGRNGVEAACLKMPVVGSDRVFSYSKLFPSLVCDPYDRCATMSKFKLAMDEKKVGDWLDFAYQEVEYFNYENSKARYMTALEESERRGGYEWYQKQTL